MRAHASVMHLDLDAYFAAVEQRDKPSLRGKPVVVGGIGLTRVVVHRLLRGAAVRRTVRHVRAARNPSRCPQAAFLVASSTSTPPTAAPSWRRCVGVSPVVEPLSLDEAFVDLAAADRPDLEVGERGRLRSRNRCAGGGVSGGLTGGRVRPSKPLAKIASDLDKPDGLVVVAPGTELDLLRPMKVTVIPGVGPATAERLRGPASNGRRAERVGEED